MKGFVYILECYNTLYYTGSTIDLEKRMKQHQDGHGANFTKKNLPVRLIYYCEFKTVGKAFRREKQIQGWSRAKKEALIAGNTNVLHFLATCQNESHYSNKVASAPLSDQSSAPLSGQSLKKN